MSMSSREAQVVKVARALGDPTRFRLLRAIAARPAISCHDLTDRFALAQATVSHHLKVLSQAGLLSSEKRGPSQHYAVRPEAVAEHSADLAAALAPARRRAAAAQRVAGRVR